MFKTRKVVIVGAGHVGSHVALALIQSGEADDIVLIDILKEKLSVRRWTWMTVSAARCAAKMSVSAPALMKSCTMPISWSWPLAAAVDPVRPGWICSTIRSKWPTKLFHI